ncbi:hypothetical protein HMPREF9104_00061 [Lentilactobacillus kisonensis F0435]|uniref:Uncharacterized protein n=1 Tax=Lentilactobacillus kisonensis F0435 TaxID=797516 RepID=H1LBV1_9LACO|nr:hypothetical protein HMPREF9104_00061 [Lentilactobacillus kisonensis F0435]
MRNQAVRDWSLSFLRQESWAWIFGGEGLGAKSLLGVAHFCNVAKEQKSLFWDFWLRWLRRRFLLCAAVLESKHHSRICSSNWR